jgi:serine O-acetyltransferase
MAISNPEAELLRERNEAYGRMGLAELLRGDLVRYDRRKAEAFTKLGFHATLLYRLSHPFSRRGWLCSARLLQLFSHVLTGAEISHNAVIGPGLGLLHPTAVMVGPNARIGKMATICQCVSVSISRSLDEVGPIIGDHLWAGPGCAIIGPVVVGDDVWIGPNAVVMKNVPPHMTVMGNPGRAVPKELFKSGGG